MKDKSWLKRFFEKRMKDFKSGNMHSRTTGTGPVVKKKSQAIAIILSEAKKKGRYGKSK